TSSPPLTLPLFYHPPSTTYTYTLSLHDALPILRPSVQQPQPMVASDPATTAATNVTQTDPKNISQSAPTPLQISSESPLAAQTRSEEHTSELQSRFDLVCRLLLEKKKNTY